MPRSKNLPIMVGSDSCSACKLQKIFIEQVALNAKKTIYYKFINVDKLPKSVSDAFETIPAWFYNGKRVNSVVDPTKLMKGKLEPLVQKKKSKKNNFGNEYNPDESWRTYYDNGMNTFFDGKGFNIPSNEYANVENLYGYGNAENGVLYGSLGLGGPSNSPRGPQPGSPLDAYQQMLATATNSFGKKRRKNKFSGNLFNEMNEGIFTRSQLTPYGGGVQGPVYY